MSNPTMTDLERAAREAQALRHVLDLEHTDRPDAARKLERAALVLRPWLQLVRREIEQAPAVGLPALWATLDRPAMKDYRDTLAAAAVDLPKLEIWDPAEARKAFAAVLADTEHAGLAAYVATASQLLAQVSAAETLPEKRAMLLDAVHELTRANQADEVTLAEAWDRHLELMGAPEAGAHEVLRLDARRGKLAACFNDNLGPRAGLEPGQTFILGGAAEAGKTSLAALLAVDALAANCPVLFWQLELSREETLEHLLAQLPEPADWWKKPFWERARRKLPDTWADLLTVPAAASPKAEDILEALQRLATQAERAERKGKKRHKCRGLVVVDYAQLLTLADADARNAQHEILATAASRLAKAAADAGACVLLLSQLNKQDQRDAAAAGTALAGADLQRMAHRVALLQKANTEGKACAAGEDNAWDPVNGGKRLLTWTKTRGVRYIENRRPDRTCILWDGGRSRAFHGGEQDQAGGKVTTLWGNA